MRVTLTITAGPHQGKAFTFDGRDTFLVGRAKDAHFHLPRDDPYFSRRHFLVEVNPPRCRVLDMVSRNGTRVNGTPVRAAELRHGDEIRAGHTVMRVSVQIEAEEETAALAPRVRTPTAVEAEPGRGGAPPDEWPAIPGYRIEAEIGAGAMGVVYRATRAADRAAVAIKTITPVVTGRPREVQRFLREARILAQLRHPHIVAFSEMGEAGGLMYFVMDLVDGTDAAALVRTGPVSPRVAVRVVCQLLAALEYAHDGGFVHRDVKPSNLLIDTRGGRRVVKLADFGLARVYAASKLSGPTLQGEMGGTPAFMAPEQITHFREAKPPADQYAAAATLYNLLTATYPHDPDPDVMPFLVRVMTEPPVPLRRRRPDLSRELAAVVHRALEREPDDRFPDVGAFRRALVPFGR